jgi:hypothetical protein
MKKFLSLCLLALFLVSPAYCENLKYIGISLFGKSVDEINALVGTTITLEATGAYNTSGFKEYSSKNDPCTWSTSNAIVHINDKGEFYCKQAGTVKIFATKGGKSAMLTLNITTEPSEAMPEPPKGIIITNITSKSASVTWDSAKYKGISYLVSIGNDESADNGGLPRMANKPYKLTWNIPVSRGLKNDQTYYVKVKAVNKYGSSDWSKSVKFKTLK